MKFQTTRTYESGRNQCVYTAWHKHKTWGSYVRSISRSPCGPGRRGIISDSIWIVFKSRGFFFFFFFYDYNVKNNRNFTDPVNSNCEKKSTGNRECTGKCPYISYINGQFTVILRIFRKFTGNWLLFYGIYPENLLPGSATFFSKSRCISRQEISG